MVWHTHVAQDFRYAVRAFRRRPVFGAVVVVTLAIGIAAITAILSVVDPLLFRSLPYSQEERLVSFGLSGPISVDEFMLGRSYVQWRSLFTPFEAVTTLSPSYRVALGLREAVEIRCVPVESNFLKTLGVRVAAGRDFAAEDDRPNAPAVALLGYRVWKQNFGGSASILQRTILLDQAPVRVIGILPKNFELPTLEDTDLLIPQKLDFAQQLRSSPGRFLLAFARLKRGISVQQARLELQPFFQHVLADVPPELRKEVHLVIRPVRDRVFGNFERVAWMLLGTALLLLVLACANVANLLLARAIALRSEFAVRMALGASRMRILLQGFSESLLFACCGGVAGSALAWALLRALRALMPETIFRVKESGLDTRMLLMTAAACLGAALLSGSVPGLLINEAKPAPETWIAGPARSWARSLLMSIQVAFSILLLTGASLLGRSLLKLETQPIGFDPSHTTVATFQLNSRKYNTPEKRDALYAEAETRLSSLPGVQSFALTDTIPPGGEEHERPFSNMAIVGEPPLPSEGGMVKFRYVTPDYFRVLRIPILAGRGFVAGDRAGPEHSVVLSKALAKRLFGLSSGVGRQIVLSDNHLPFTVIGVAGDVKNDGLADAAMPEYYLLRKRHNDFPAGGSAAILFRSPLAPGTFVTAIRSQLAALDPDLAVQIRSMSEVVSMDSRRPRFLTALVGLFAAFGLAIAAIGMYGIAHFLVVQRTREIGVRMAMGATRGQIAAAVIKDCLLRCSVGVAAGLLVYLLVAKTIRSLLFGISEHDPASLALSISGLILAALLASWSPSRRAAKIDPNVALRYE